MTTATNRIIENPVTSTSLTPTSASDESVKNCGVGNNASGNDKENKPYPNANHCIVKDDGIDGSSISEKEAPVSASTTIQSQPSIPSILSRPREIIAKEISKQVLRHKLQKLRHLVVKGAISEEYLDNKIFHPKLLELFDPQSVVYNGGIANVKKWKISCYLEVMEGGVPCTNPNVELLDVFLPLLETCDDLFMLWYKQQHACNNARRGRSSSTSNKNNSSSKQGTKTRKCKRLMTFVTRYTPAPGEQALLKHVDGAGKVDGSCVVALPIDRWSAPEDVNSWYGHGGGLTFWDGREPVPEEESNESAQGNDAAQQQRLRRKPRSRPKEIHYETRSGDVAFIDRAVWHQADPITKGTRWALVIFYKVTEEEEDECETENAVTSNDKRKE